MEKVYSEMGKNMFELINEDVTTDQKLAMTGFLLVASLISSALAFGVFIAICRHEGRWEEFVSIFYRNKSGNAGEVDPEIKRRVIENIVRRGHEVKHRLHVGYADNGKEHAENEGQRHGSLDRGMELLLFLCAETLPDHHAGTHGKPVEKEHQHIDDHGGGAHRGQCFRADKISHHDGVHRVVQHLEDVAEEKRK